MKRPKPARHEMQQVAPEINQLYTGCISLADILLELKDPKAARTFQEVLVPREPQEVLERLQAIRAGELLAALDDEIDITPMIDDIDMFGVSKRDATLQRVGIVAWDWDSGVLDDADKIRKIDIEFHYLHPAAKDGVTETISLYVWCGEVTLMRGSFVKPHDEDEFEDSEDHALVGQTDQDIIDFIELVAWAVGDNPTAALRRERGERTIR
ncbi:MAG TPA: hypothetical protein PKV96_01970 [Candidatus Saccharimonas sp.]|jgi:hypothetical protein|nr:hypothetical protein [Candidatus Saccharimonas sp.]